MNADKMEVTVFQLSSPIHVRCLFRVTYPSLLPFSSSVPPPPTLFLSLSHYNFLCSPPVSICASLTSFSSFILAQSIALQEGDTCSMNKRMNIHSKSTTQDLFLITGDAHGQLVALAKNWIGKAEVIVCFIFMYI